MGEWCVLIPGLGRLASGLSGCIVYSAVLFTCCDKKDTFLGFSILRK